MNTSIFGLTHLQLPILAYEWGQQGPQVLILGGVHGNESEGVTACLGIMQKFQEKYTFNLRVTIVPCLNWDGLMKLERRNYRGVDLNRNLPTKDWTNHISEEKYNPGLAANSEPENHALVKYINDKKPAYIYSLHSWKPCLNINGDSRPEAEVIAQKTGYNIVEDIGYPTPGCLGAYAAIERQIPTLTYEIERGLDGKKIVAIHVPAVIESLSTLEKRLNKNER